MEDDFNINNRVEQEDSESHTSSEEIISPGLFVNPFAFLVNFYLKGVSYAKFNVDFENRCCQV